jgi:hypothetical protein
VGRAIERAIDMRRRAGPILLTSAAYMASGT